MTNYTRPEFFLVTPEYTDTRSPRCIESLIISFVNISRDKIYYRHIPSIYVYIDNLFAYPRQ